MQAGNFLGFIAYKNPSFFTTLFTNFWNNVILLITLFSEPFNTESTKVQIWLSFDRDIIFYSKYYKFFEGFLKVKTSCSIFKI